MTLYKWSQTASADATADSTVNWAEGQSPSSVNDSARAMMAAIAKYRDDMAGAIVTSGTSTAYSMSSFQGFDSLTHLNGQAVAFVPHTTNGATVTLNVDGLGPRPLRSAPGIELPSGIIIQGTPYDAVYNNSDGAFYLRGLFGNPYNIPIGAGFDYWGAAAPNSSFVFPYGQAISRSIYDSLFALFGTTYGAGDGLTTFNIPDLRGRITAKKDDMGGSAAGRLTASYFGTSASNLGAAGGVEGQTITIAQMPIHSHGVTDPGHAHTPPGVSAGLWGDNVVGSAAGGGNAFQMTHTTIPLATTGISIQTTGSGGAHNNVQPTIICNYVIRII
ncbi:phage tail protein [Bradyrhizobium sp. CCBAU 51627]|uniref:phage tail protein n=1 Tax=Bradyrhizobium sp. CCBAU 51627 TaxID=1325088 RepID=UPI0023064694|nr:tail fiber protein [Bradyrhizobium sp. CCBAU 51627]MDA9435815.1 tail protein [Bradyrhizobium sp. CCBAU 51627]